jgi:hypothetical protein
MECYAKSLAVSFLTGIFGDVEELERMAKVSVQTCHGRWKTWCRKLVASRATELWLTPELFEARYRCPALRPVCLRIVAK